MKVRERYLSKGRGEKRVEKGEIQGMSTKWM